jgi:YD repeat-containing protein
MRVSTNVSPADFGYLYNDLNQRTRETSGDGSTWIYGYDSIGQFTSGKTYWAEGVPIEGQQFEYTYDDIGNRTSTKEGGDQYGNNLRSATYTPNTLNQYTTRSVPDKANIIGHSTSTSTVTINSSNADYRHGPYFREELSLSNTGTNAIWQSVTVTAGTDKSTGNFQVFLSGYHSILNKNTGILDVREAMR